MTSKLPGATFRLDHQCIDHFSRWALANLAIVLSGLCCHICNSIFAHAIYNIWFRRCGQIGRPGWFLWFYICATRSNSLQAGFFFTKHKYISAKFILRCLWLNQNESCPFFLGGGGEGWGVNNYMQYGPPGAHMLKKLIKHKVTKQNGREISLSLSHTEFLQGRGKKENGSRKACTTDD